MRLHKKYTEAYRNKHAEALLELIHDDFSLVSLGHGVTGNRKSPSAVVHFLIGSGKTISAQNERSIHENEHILTEGKVMSLLQARREAFICV